MPPVKALDSVTMSGTDAGVLEGEHCAGAAEAGEDLIEDQQKLVSVGQYAQMLQHAAS